MSQRGYRPWAMLGNVQFKGKHSQAGNKKHRAKVMGSFLRSVVLRTPHPLATAREEATAAGKSDRWAKNLVREARR